jgi:glycosyltransferase involved in cell wall biosynthesis
MTLEGSRVLFISYNGMLDPLGQSQVIPYLRQLAERGVQFTLLSFERPTAFEAQGVATCEELRRELANHNIDWHILRYHQTPSLPATSYDVVTGIRYASALVKRKGIQLVHARSHIPATISLALKRRFGLKMIFDLRGLMADEYADAGHWRRGSLAFRLTKTMERRILAQSDAIVTLTQAIWPILKKWDGLSDREVFHEVIPCCADLEHFKFSSEARAAKREELGLGDRFSLVYSGSIDGWYLTEQMADFFKQLLTREPGAHFLWLTPSRHDRIRQIMSERGVQSESYSIKSVPARDVPSYLSASDASIAFIKPCFSKLASSPTKTAEYLGCGLPLLLNAGIGDSDSLITDEKAGALVREFSNSEYLRAFNEIRELRSDLSTLRKMAHETATKLFDLRSVGVPRYARLYERTLRVSEHGNS